MSNTIDLVEREEIERILTLRALQRAKKKEASELTEQDIEAAKAAFPEVASGDVVKVFVKVTEGTRERLQNFEGTVIAKKNGGLRETFTVRRLSYGIGVERTFPVYSTKIDHIEIIRHGKVRRAKLYYLRERKGKAAKVKEIKKF
ncbi:MAG TPA: 50S ribosomal protein L19 [Eubacteriales bacterium]|jgi:large subunit ribosomal protein L19|nr:50S ribosomal protein L19 [Eubacteriales bacterium]HRU83998.1 50S ribosomal protein L19 [Eubacteriales bacterium]